MRKVLFVNPPNHWHDRFSLAPPLGILVLSQVARSVGWNPQIIDLALSSDADSPERFYESALAAIMNENPRVVCFTSMGVNTHIAVELAEKIKDSDSAIAVCVGGVHFSSLAERYGEAFPAIDTFVVGEGEEGLTSVLAQMVDGSAERLPHIVTGSGRGRNAEHPHSSYDLIAIEEYFRLNPRRVVDYEGGRGCVFKCSFCYSPAHFPSVSEVAPEQIVQDWTRLARLGFEHVFMVQDNFTNSPTHALAVCEALAAADIPIFWNGYATLPQLNARVAKALGSARCKQLYLGVDAVTASQSAIFNKRFFRSSDNLRSCLQALQAEGVEPTCAFMLDLFEFDEAELEKTLEVAAECAAVGASIRLNVFTRYLTSGLATSGDKPARYSEAKVRMALDCPEVVRVNRFARKMAGAFPFHATEVEDEAVWIERLRLVWLAQRLIQAHPDDFREFALQDDYRIVGGLMKLVRNADWEDILKSTGSPPFQFPVAEVY